MSYYNGNNNSLAIGEVPKSSKKERKANKSKFDHNDQGFDDMMSEID
jgi:hypothetical protein